LPRIGLHRNARFDGHTHTEISLAGVAAASIPRAVQLAHNRARRLPTQKPLRGRLASGEGT